MANESLGYLGKVVIGSTTVGSLKDWKLTVDGNEVDISAFGTDWNRYLVGMKKWSATASGSFVQVTDTNGQAALWTAFLAGTGVAIKLYTDATHYFTSDTATITDACAYIKKMDVDTSAPEAVKVSYEFSGSGPLKFV